MFQFSNSLALLFICLYLLSSISPVYILSISGFSCLPHMYPRDHDPLDGPDSPRPKPLWYLRQTGPPVAPDPRPHLSRSGPGYDRHGSDLRRSAEEITEAYPATLLVWRQSFGHGASGHESGIRHCTGNEWRRLLRCKCWRW